MLSKEKCTQAITSWREIKSNYTEDEKLINPMAAFSFSQEDCKWLNDNNNNSKFHTYIGNLDNQLILIVVPLHEDGKEVDLSFYLTSTLAVLSDELTLVETAVVTTTEKTTLSKELEVTNYCEEVQLPTSNEPTITERASVSDIEKWKNSCLDWFYFECNDHQGERIFNTFTVPFADLVKENEIYDEVKGFFGFKESFIYQRTIPVLIFVAIDSKTNHAQIIREIGTGDNLYTNTRDWSQPCPPLCRESKNFNLLG